MVDGLGKRAAPWFPSSSTSSTRPTSSSHQNIPRAPPQPRESREYLDGCSKSRLPAPSFVSVLFFPGCWTRRECVRGFQEKDGGCCSRSIWSQSVWGLLGRSFSAPGSSAGVEHGSVGLGRFGRHRRGLGHAKSQPRAPCGIKKAGKMSVGKVLMSREQPALKRHSPNGRPGEEDTELVLVELRFVRPAQPCLENPTAFPIPWTSQASWLTWLRVPLITGSGAAWVPCSGVNCVHKTRFALLMVRGHFGAGELFRNHYHALGSLGFFLSSEAICQKGFFDNFTEPCSRAR